MRHRWPGAAARHRTGAPEERSLNATFIGAFPRADVVLEHPLPEIAFLGRSNVGKSSLLNAFLGQKIARTSAAPGKTRALNVYQTASLYLLDLPGYGYARVSQTERAHFRGLVRHVIERPRLVGVVWLLDIRREPSPEDQAMQDLFTRAGTHVLAALTKSDKLPRSQRLARAEELRATLEVPEEQVVVTSVQAREGIDELREAVAALIGRTS
jgi:GTP-binding protein